MGKTLGYSKNEGSDWFNSNAYSERDIETIKDPEGGSQISTQRSQPTPFTNLDLVRTAFENISHTPELKAYSKQGEVIAGNDDEKLVSDCLDLTEMLFNIDSVKDQLEIIVWDREKEIQSLKSGSAAQRRYAEALELYLIQDADSFNFENLERLYLIRYNHKIIGCTSPVSLFFTTKNDLSHAQIKLTKNDIFFDDKYASLYERDVEFQKYLYLLFHKKVNPILRSKMKAFADYLDKNLKIIETLSKSFTLNEKERKRYQTLHQDLKNLDTNDFNLNYEELNTGNAGDIIEVLGAPLRKRKKENVINSIKRSDFVIRSEKHKDLLPLILQNNLNKPLKYANDTWDSSIKVPYANDETDLKKRWLPGLKIQFPYLTVSDFLEPYLIRLIYPIYNEKYFDGNLVIDSGDDSKGYLLPLKKQFFNFFNTQDLLNEQFGKPKIEIRQGQAKSVKVTLSIPIAKEGEYISFERIYYPNAEGEISKPHIENNKGIILEHKFGLAIFPFIQTNNADINAFHRIQLIEADFNSLLKDSKYELDFYSNSSNNHLEETHKVIRNQKHPQQTNTHTSEYYVIENEFDFISFKNNTYNVSGIIIPKWELKGKGNKEFSFAVDFGTTNTHIEYKIDNGSPQPFNISHNDIQTTPLFHPTKTKQDFTGTGANEIREIIDDEFVPRLLGELELYGFPQRTAISQSNHLDLDTTTHALANFNIPFTYGKRLGSDINEVLLNLKWAKHDPENETRVSAFFEEIIMLLRNKVLLNQGDLSKTKFIWFYPSSMKHGRKSTMGEMWNSHFKYYFNSINEPVGVTESEAPFYFYRKTLPGRGAHKPVVSIDIGGGTSDVLVFNSGKPVFITSFKFAANSIFGDGLNEYGSSDSNGLIRKYLNHFENILAKNKLYNLAQVLQNITQQNRSEDINAFLFSIENNKDVKDNKLFSYNLLLSKDEDLKIVFIYFYSAIIYHIAKLMKTRQVDLPKQIIFSGTGSKLLSIVTDDITILNNLSLKIFETIYEEPFDNEGLSIFREKDKPKEVTCKGGLQAKPEEFSSSLKAFKATLTCLEEQNINQLTYEALNETNKSHIIKYVEEFNSFFLKLNSEYNFEEYFNSSNASINLFKKEVNKHLRDYLEASLALNKNINTETEAEEVIEETLFFYPILGTIHNVLNQLTNLNDSI